MPGGSAAVDLIALSNLPWDSYFPPGEGPALGADARTHPANQAIVAPWLEPPLRERLEGEAVGGSPTNVALAFAGLGGRARVVGPVAEDAWGRRIRAALAGADIELHEIAPPPLHQAQSLAFREGDGERRFLATSPELSEEAVLPPLRWSDPGWLVASSYEFRSPVFGRLVTGAFEAARRGDRRTAFDLAGRHAVLEARREIAALLAGGMDVVLAGTDALEALLDREGVELDAAALRAVAEVVVETRGAGGVRLVTAHAERWFAPEPAEVVDTTGAGDALLGAILLALSCGWPPEGAVTRGIEVAAECLRHAGAHLPEKRLALLRPRFRPAGG